MPAVAQLRPFGDAHAIVGARIEIGDGRVIEKGTVLVRNGLIEAVGPNVAVPPDAEVLKADGLIVYPGFIDAWTTKGLKLPAWQPDQDVPPDTAAEASPSMREANRRWVRPELRAFEYFSLSDADAAPLRKSGFTAALAAPSGGLINGRAALIGLSGRPKRESAIIADSMACLSVRLNSSGDFFGGGYPGTPLGYFAHIRQTFHDVEWATQLADAQRSGGPRRPPADDVLSALRPVLAGQVPALIEADSELEIAHALALAEEFRLNPVICGGAQAYKQLTPLVKARVPVILGLKFGEEPKLPGDPPKPEPPKADDKKPGETKPDQKKSEDKKPEDEPDADLPLAARKEKKRIWDERLGNAKKVSEAGVVFAFTTRGCKDTSEFWTNLRRVVKEGLPREAALKALTISAAKIVGADKQLGTVQAGKIANLTIMSADFTDEKAKAKYVFVDGRKFDTEIESSSSGPKGGGGGDDAGRGR
jgi:hypothetical protein